MTAYILALGVVTVITIQMAGAVLYVTGSLSHRGMLKVLARHLRRGEDEALVECFTPFESMTRVMKKRRRLCQVIAGLLAAGAAAVVVCGFLAPGALVYAIPGLLVSALNLLIAAGVLSVWIRQLRRMPDTG